MTGILAALGIIVVASAARVSADPICVPIPHADEIVTLVEPRNAAIYDPRGIWIEFSVAPFGQDIRGFFMLSATATPLDGGASRPLRVDSPYRLSGDTLGGASPMSALWIAHVAKPDVPSRITVTYGINLLRSPTGAPCDGPLDVRRIGDFIWVPTNGVGPFGQRPPVR